MSKYQFIVSDAEGDKTAGTATTSTRVTASLSDKASEEIKDVAAEFLGKNYIFYVPKDSTSLSIKSNGHDDFFPDGAYDLSLDDDKLSVKTLADSYKETPPASAATQQSAIDNYDAVKTKVVAYFKEGIDKIETTGPVNKGWFGKNGPFDIVAKKALLDLEYGQVINPNPTFEKRIENIAVAATPEGIKKGAIKSREDAFLGLIRVGLNQKLDSITEDTDLSKFLKDGKKGYTEGTPEAILYKNVVSLSELFGVKPKLVEVIDGISKKDDSSGAGGAETPKTGSDGKESKPETSTGSEAAQTATPTPKKDAGESGSTEKARDERTSDTEDTTDSVKTQPEGGRFALFYTVFRAESEGLKINLAFTDGKSLTYDVPPGRVGTPLGLSVDAPGLADALAQNKGSDISVTITGRPSTGGKEITTAAQIAPVRWPVPTSRYLVGNLTFVMAKAAGKIDFSGLQADVGRGGAKDFEGGAGRVHEIFYTEGGGVDDAYVDCAVTASGRTYVFTFSGDPLLVPIEVNVKQDKIQNLQESKKPILNEAVPHWIFLRPGRSGGAGAGGGAGKGAGGGTGVNVAVSRVVVKTDVKWISVPNVGNPWDTGSVRIDIRQGSGKALTNTAPGAVNILCRDDLGTLGLSEKDVREKITNTLFNRSAAYLKMGLECWSDDPTVTGNSVASVTKREITQSTIMSAR